MQTSKNMKRGSSNSSRISRKYVYLVFLLSTLVFLWLYWRIPKETPVKPQDVLRYKNGEISFMRDNSRNTHLYGIESVFLIPAIVKHVERITKVDRANMGLLDVGAHIGFWAMSGCSLGLHSAIAVEPIPSNAAIIRRNAKLNNWEDRLFCVQAVAGDKAGGVVFIDENLLQDQSPDGQVLGNTVDVPLLGKRRNWGGNKIVHGVPVVLLDQIVDFDNPEIIAVAKIDVEGCEGQVINGAKKLLKSGKVKSVFVELSPSNTKSITGVSAGEYLKTLIDLGFLLYQSDCQSIGEDVMSSLPVPCHYGKPEVVLEDVFGANTMAEKYRLKEDMIEKQLKALEDNTLPGSSCCQLNILGLHSSLFN